MLQGNSYVYFIHTVLGTGNNKINSVLPVICNTNLTIHFAL